MVDFRRTKTRSKATEKNGRSFLTEAQEQHRELFRAYVDQAGDYRRVEEYTEALQSDAWKLTEQIAKQSWRNGIARGESKARRK